MEKGIGSLYLPFYFVGELETVLEKDFGWGKERIQGIVERIRAKAIEVQPKINISIIIDKEDDNRILQCAIEGKAQYIVSGDERHLQPLKEYQGIRILSPAEFLKLI